MRCDRSQPSNTTCPRCNERFRCDVNDASGCWCFTHPPLSKPIDGVPADQCVCQACLRAAAEPSEEMPKGQK